MSGEATSSLWLGPPPPRAITQLMRAVQVAVAAVMLTWLFGYLGGLRLSPKPLAQGGNDTGQLFNWHPLLITLAFPVLMAEAVLAYKTPLVPLKSRPHSKAYHFLLHSAALACVVLGVVAAFKSHTLKRPTPTPNLYSVHSWLGLGILSLLGFQYSLAAVAYLYPKLSLEKRRALGPLHRFLGQGIFVGGLATMALGIQEKATFVQVFAKPPSVHAAVMALPALLVVLLFLLGLLAMFHHLPTPAGAQQQWHQEETVSLVAAEGSGAPPDAEDSHTA